MRVGLDAEPVKERVDVGQVPSIKRCRHRKAMRSREPAVEAHEADASEHVGTYVRERID